MQAVARNSGSNDKDNKDCSCCSNCNTEEMEGPSTPKNTTTHLSRPPSLLRSPLRSPEQPETALTTPRFLPGFSDTTTSPSHNDTERMISAMLEWIEQNPQVSLDSADVKRVLQKCLMTLSHYKLQNNILRFESNEQGQRNAIETDLIQTQVDFLLKSPFKPSDEKLGPSTPRTAVIKKSKVVKPKLHLVERRVARRDDQFGNLTKVFHLERQ